MCGRYALGVATERIVAKFDVTAILTDQIEPQEQVRPTNLIPVITQPEQGSRILEPMRWGLVPSWSKDVSGRPLINARAETLAEKPAFKRLLSRKRCLIPSDGFYEWSNKKNSAGKQDMYFFTIGDRELYAYAGLFDDWYDPTTNEVLRSTALITCAPNPLIETIHDRMPAILNNETAEQWLTAANDTEFLSQLLKPYPAGEMHAELCITDTPPRVAKTSRVNAEDDTLSLF